MAKSNRRRNKLPANIRKHAEVLVMLARAKPQLAKQIIAGADQSLLKSISECSLNILKGVVPLTPKQKSKLRRYKNRMRSLATTTSKRNAKEKKALLMRGGFVGALLGTVAPLLVSALGGLLFNKKR